MNQTNNPLGCCGEETGKCCSMKNNCGCPEGSWGLSSYPLAMVYSPCQTFRNLYDKETALSRGTLFKELDLPFEGYDRGNCTRRCF